MTYEVLMRISAAYRKVVDAENEEEAKDIAWDEGDFGEAFDIDGEFVSCVPVTDTEV